MSNSQFGPPKGNTNALTHGLYRSRTRDRIKAQRLRRRVNRKLEGEPEELKPVLRENLKDIENINDVLETIEADFDRNGITNESGEPRRLLGEYRLYLKLKLDFNNANGLTATSLASSRKDYIHGELAFRRWMDGANS